jgi:glycerol-3-phosphate dehydrogenase
VSGEGVPAPGGARRSPEALLGGPFDVLVVGGGILGASIARDAVLRGLSVALVERGDFAGGTSANSLKVIHGGLRHLQHLDLAELRRSVTEQRTWLAVAPHLVEPLPVLVPFGRRAEGLLLRAGLAAYNLLSADRNRGLAHDRRLPAGRMLDRSEALETGAPLVGHASRGAALYHDALMYSPERLVLEILFSARERGAVVVNHVACAGGFAEGGRRQGIMARDALTGDEFPVRARTIVNACGPGADGVEARILGRAAPPSGGLSLAWNVVVSDVGSRVAVGLPGRASTPTGGGGGRPRRLFVVPWRGRTLVGTGHAPFHGTPEDFTGLDPDDPLIVSFLGEVNRALPEASISPDEVLRIHSGLLPAHTARSRHPSRAGRRPGAGGGGDHGPRVRLRRRPELRVHEDGGAPLVTASTVKFTAARRVAEKVIDRISGVFGHRGIASKTAMTPLRSAPPRGFEALSRTAHEALSGELPGEVIDHLVRTYGTGYRDVHPPDPGEPDGTDLVASDSPVVRAQLLHGVRAEMAMTPEDLLYRRTEIGARGAVTEPLLAAAREILAGAGRTHEKGTANPPHRPSPSASPSRSGSS